MENKEIMTNEVMEATEETIMNNSTKILKTLGIIGGTLLVGDLAYKYVIKPMIQKHKDSKNVDEDAVVVDEADFNDVSDSKEE